MTTSVAKPKINILKMNNIIVIFVLCAISLRRTEAEATCGPNESYESGGFACQTCKNYQTAFCAFLNEYRCYCHPGYVRDANGNCIRPEDCPVITRYTRNSPAESKCSGANEEYICGTKCLKSCTTLDIAISCIEGCDEGCFCKEGFVRNEETGECIKPTQCPTCAQNETYKSGGFDCQDCSNYQIVRCPSLNEYRCYCLPGHVRDAGGSCIRTEDCSEAARFARSIPEIQCNIPNEEYSPCQPGPCESTCQHTERGIGCATVCVPDGCKCKQGFLRDAVTRECVPEANCP